LLRKLLIILPFYFNLLFKFFCFTYVLAKNTKIKAGMVAHPVTWEVVIRRIAVQGQPGQKVSKTPYQQISWNGGTCT
jgi:hypothetical protein